MSKKMMLLAVGALAALAFTVLAGTATAQETRLRCEFQGICTFTVNGGVARFSVAGGDTVACTNVEGNGEVTGLNEEQRESTTSTVQLRFLGCREQNTIFHFGCQSTATAEVITTNVMTMHNIAINTGTRAGVLLTGAGVTFTCAGGFASTQLTGNLIGEYGAQCNTNTWGVQKVNFVTAGDGAQSLTSYTGSTYRLEGRTSHSDSGSYVNAAQSGEASLSFNQNVILTCS